MQARCGLSIAPLFSPAVIPAHRGMIVEVPLPLSAMPAAASPDALRAALTDFYGTSPIVVMGAAPESGEMLLRASDAGDDRLELFVFANADGSQARLVARLEIGRAND